MNKTLELDAVPMMVDSPDHDYNKVVNHLSRLVDQPVTPVFEQKVAAFIESFSDTEVESWQESVRKLLKPQLEIIEEGNTILIRPKKLNK